MGMAQSPVHVLDPQVMVGDPQVMVGALENIAIAETYGTAVGNLGLERHGLFLSHVSEVQREKTEVMEEREETEVMEEREVVREMPEIEMM